MPNKTPMKQHGMQQLQNFIESELARREWNASELASRAKLNSSVVSRLLKREGGISEPELKTLDKLAQALRVQRWQLVRILDGDTDTNAEVRVRALAHRLANLPIPMQDAVDAFLTSIEDQSKK